MCPHYQQTMSPLATFSFYINSRFYKLTRKQEIKMQYTGRQNYPESPTHFNILIQINIFFKKEKYAHFFRL